MKSLRWLLALVMLLAPLSAGAQKWRAHTYPEDGFEVQFNGFVTVRPLNLPAEVSERIERGTQYLQEGESALYLVSASLNRQALAFENGVERGFAGLGCKTMVSDRVIEAPWGKGRALRGVDCVDGDYRVEAHYYHSGLWFYQVLALYREDVGDEASARYFLQSFRVVRRR